MKQFLLNFTSVHLAPLPSTPLVEKPNVQNQRWRRPPSWISKNVSNFHKDEAILTKCLQSTPGTSLYRSVVSDVHILKKVQDDGGRHLGYRKLSIISTRMKLFSPNFNSVHLVQTNFITFDQKCIVSLSIV